MKYSNVVKVCQEQVTQIDCISTAGERMDGGMAEEERNMEKNRIGAVLLMLGRQTEQFGELEREFWLWSEII